MRTLADHEFRVGDSLVQPRLARIQRGGETIQVTPRAMAVLVHLAEANGAVVSRNDLLDAVWPRMDVTPDALSQCIVELRRAFGDDSKSPTVIETIRKMGVRLLLPIAVEGDVEPQAQESSGTAVSGTVSDREPRRFTRTLVAIVVAVVALGAVWYFWPGERAGLSTSTTTPVSGKRSIAVLPLTFDSTADDRVRLFADGIHDELLTRLANIEALDKVISRPISLGFRDTQKTPKEMGQELGVGAVFQGRVRRIEDTIRLDVQLIDTATGAVLWAGNYTKTLSAKDLFAVQSEAAVAIADALNAKLSADELARLRAVPTTNTRAYEYYLSGIGLRRRDINPNQTLPLILQQYSKAVQEDPNFALAWARLSDAHTGMYFRGLDPTPQRLELAEAAFRRAFELAPGLPEAHVAKAAYLARGPREYDRALAELAIAEPALRHDPEFYHLRMYVHLYKREFDLALIDNNTMLELDPHNIVYLRSRSQAEISKGDYAAAEGTLDRILRLAPDDGTACVDLVDLALHRYGDTAFATRHDCTRQPAYATALASTYVRWRAAVFDRDYGRALRLLDSSNEDPVFDGDLRNSFHPKSLLYARTHQLAGNRSQALRYFQQTKAAIEEQLASPKMKGKPFEPLRISLAEVQAALGDREGAMASLERAGSFPSTLQGRAARFAVVIRVLIPLGEHERALKELDDCLEASRGWTIEGLLKDPRIDPVRNDPRFAALVAKYKGKTYQREASLPKK
jgi:TolB-like protein/DNA-binding winged helix-turn-helix (wHTH) protein/Tfp pilus assembly protein PilF